MQAQEVFVIAERKYLIGDNPTLALRIYLPYSERPGLFKCRYELSGGKVQKTMSVAGIDAIEAIDNAFWLAGTELANLNESIFDGMLHWEGAQRDRQLGLPSIRGSNVSFKDY